MNFDITGRYSHKIPFRSGYLPGKPGKAARFRLFLRQFSAMVRLNEQDPAYPLIYLPILQASLFCEPHRMDSKDGF